MLTRSELPENPVSFAVKDPDGRRHHVEAERMRGGSIRMTCSCAASRSEGWCRHQVELLCLRYDQLAERNEELEFRFEDIVAGTSIADVADEVDLALADYDKALASIKTSVPAAFESQALRYVADLASDLADAARQLDVALGRFRKKLAAGSDPRVTVGVW
jgi:hypothetical protein